MSSLVYILIPAEIAAFNWNEYSLSMFTLVLFWTINMRRFIIFCLFLIILSGAAFVTHSYLSNKPQEQNVLTLYGNIDIRQVDLGFRVSGRVQSMPFEEGDFIHQGTLVASLDKQPYEDQVQQAKARVISLQASLANAEKLLQRRRRLAGSGSISREDYEAALSNKDVLQANLQEAEAALDFALTNLRDTEVFAPIDGIILTRIREPGAIAREADPIYTLSILSPVWVRAYISEPYLGVVYPGMPAEVFTDTKRGLVYQGHVGFISPVAEFTPKTVETTQLRTDLVYRLRIIVDNPDRGLRQGMPVTVKLYLKPNTR